MWGVCLRQAKAVSIEGHPDPLYNGVYTHDSTHEGWPVLKNAKGMYCYRCTPTDEWVLHNKFTPDKASCMAGVVSTEGTLPVGARAWWCRASGKWVQRTITVTLQ